MTVSAGGWPEEGRIRMTTFRELLEKKNLIVLDGPMGTELERRGYDVNDLLWSARFLEKNPDAILQIHRDYFRAGADIGTCASYQATVPGFVKAGYTKGEAEALIRKSMKLVLEARDLWWKEDGGSESGRPYPMAAGDVGPYGAYLADGSEYTGGYHMTKKDYQDFHRRRMEILREEGAEIFAVETCPKLEEAVACAELLEDMGADYWISFTFRSADEISDGTKIKDVADALRDYPHLQAVSVNCTPPELVHDILQNFRAVSDLNLAAYPNSGEVYDGLLKKWSGLGAGETFLDRAKIWYDDGAVMLGGCCRTKPADIRSIARWAREEAPGRRSPVTK